MVIASGDARLTAGLAAAWRLSVAEQPAILALAAAEYAAWAVGERDPEWTTVASTRLGHLLAIHVAVQSFYGSADHAADAVRPPGTAPDLRGAAVSVLMAGDLSALVAVRRAFEARAGASSGRAVQQMDAAMCTLQAGVVGAPVNMRAVLDAHGDDA